MILTEIALLDAAYSVTAAPVGDRYATIQEDGVSPFSLVCSRLLHTD